LSGEIETLVVQAEMTELARIADWAERLAEALDLPASVVFAIQLCLEEAVANVVRHGHPHREPPGHPPESNGIRLTLERHDDSVTATVCDTGVAFDPCSLPPPAHAATVDEAVIGGQGVHLMRKFSQHMGYERRGGTNRLTFRFDLPRASA
jgi:anti-sigma regulatory factor (Ser/Thr protein kinase)